MTRSMARPDRRAVSFLFAGGLVLLVAAAAAILVGWLDPAFISDQLPSDAAIDAAAAGGAAVALGSAVGLLGVAHVAIGAAIHRRMGPSLTLGVVLGGSMTVLSFALAVAALVSIASEAAPAVVLGPAAGCLVVASIGYGATTVAVMHAAAAAG